MADLSITAANVERASGSIQHATATVAITAGQVISVATAGTAVLGTNASDQSANTTGIALNEAAANQPISYLAVGQLDVGATLTIGELYVASAAGAISPVGDHASADYLTVLGQADATDNLILDINTTGIAKT